MVAVREGWDCEVLWMVESTWDGFCTGSLPYHDNLGDQLDIFHSNMILFI